jgi:hypothetical protein
MEETHNHDPTGLSGQKHRLGSVHNDAEIGNQHVVAYQRVTFGEFPRIVDLSYLNTHVLEPLNAHSAAGNPGYNSNSRAAGLL